MFYSIPFLLKQRKVRIIDAYIIVVLSVICFFWVLMILKIDISSQSKGITRPIQEPTYISSLQNGTIVYQNLIKNSLVHAGDTLLLLSQDQLTSQIRSQDSLLLDRQYYSKDLEFLISDQQDSLISGLGLATLNDYNNQLLELKSRVALAQKNYNRQRVLYRKGVIAPAEYEEHLYNLRFAKQKFNSFKKQQLTNWNTTLQELENEILSIEATLYQLEVQKQDYVITAPISGTLENVVPITTGSNIMAGQQLAMISSNDELIIESAVSPSDIGLLKVGQAVTVQFDAFNYNQWGMIQGEVIEIDKNITITENGSFFNVRCKLYSHHLSLKNGYTTTIKKGMTATTRFFITRRRISDLLFDKVDDWFNPKLQ